jgi:membrane-associated phospholipid phosphatase
VLAGRSRLWVIDAGAAQWGGEHATPASTAVLTTVTLLGDTAAVTVLAAATVAFETARHGLRSRWPDAALFMVAVVAGQNILSNGLKLLFTRPRPPVVSPPATTALVEAPGFAFPSGHAAAAAATFAAVALLLGRGRSWPVRVALAAAAAGMAAAVSASRVMLGVHWVTDVLGGAALGGLWFLVCALAFGGRRLKFAAPLERMAARSAPGTRRTPGQRVEERGQG